MSEHGQTPAQTIGPFFHDCLMDLVVDDLAPGSLAGQQVRLSGRVLDGAGAPVSDAMIEIWQANPTGRYLHPLDEWPEHDADFVGFGRVATDDGGRWSLRTIVPGPVVQGDGTTNAPHLNVQVFARGLLDMLCTRIYFPGEPANDADPVLANVPADRRGGLIATHDGDGARFTFDIVLQGDDETPFFDV